MMNILERYIARTVASATGLVTLAIMGVSFLMLLLGEMKEIGKGDYGVLQALYYTLMRLPNQIYQFSPMLMLLGGVIGLTVLMTNRELAVMRSSGFSMQRIIRSVLYVVLGLVVFFTSVGEFIGPHLGYHAEINKENAQNGGQAVVTSTGIWFHLENDFIHVEHVVDRHLMQGVTRFQFNRQHQLQTAYFAKVLSQKDKQWVMYEVVKTTFHENRIRSDSYPQMPWDLTFNTNLLNIGLVEPNELSLPKLAKFIKFLESNNLQANQYKYEFWQRTLQPFASIIIVLLAIPFVLGGRMTTQLGWRIIIAIMVGFTFFLLNAVLSQVSIVYQLPALFAALIPLILFSGIGFIFMRKLLN